MSVPVAPYPCPVSCLGGQPGSIHIPQVTVNATGPIVTLVNMAQVLKLHCQLQSLAKTGTSPTLDVKLQESLDNGATWSDVSGATFTQLTGAGVPHVDALVDVTALHGDQLRFYATLGGTAGPSMDVQLDVTLLWQ